MLKHVHKCVNFVSLFCIKQMNRFHLLRWKLFALNKELETNFNRLDKEAVNGEIVVLSLKPKKQQRFYFKHSSRTESSVFLSYFKVFSFDAVGLRSKTRKYHLHKTVFYGTQFMRLRTVSTEDLNRNKDRKKWITSLTVFTCEKSAWTKCWMWRQMSKWPCRFYYVFVASVFLLVLFCVSAVMKLQPHQQ